MMILMSWTGSFCFAIVGLGCWSVVQLWNFHRLFVSSQELCRRRAQGKRDEGPVCAVAWSKRNRPTTSSEEQMKVPYLMLF